MGRVLRESLTAARVQICAGSVAAVEDLSFSGIEDCSRVFFFLCPLRLLSLWWWWDFSCELRGLASRRLLVYMVSSFSNSGCGIEPCFKELPRVSISRVRLSCLRLVA
ncbi:hypothetical protein F2Q69_00001736 [Brassica cretica]|uniref:Uncharacterized protein n=1 Tax=Brassica cretica TaxID=69181 RepID=A0A8S9NZV8_BRACR|nr:hypothetical protein F2Q69_00001736 [Brassica cretica]